MRLKNNPNKMNNKRNSGVKLKFKKILKNHFYYKQMQDSLRTELF